MITVRFGRALFAKKRFCCYLSHMSVALVDNVLVRSRLYLTLLLSWRSTQQKQKQGHPSLLSVPLPPPPLNENANWRPSLLECHSWSSPSSTPPSQFGFLIFVFFFFLLAFCIGIFWIACFVFPQFKEATRDDPFIIFQRFSPLFLASIFRKRETNANDPWQSMAHAWRAIARREKKTEQKQGVIINIFYNQSSVHPFIQ